MRKNKSKVISLLLIDKNENNIGNLYIKDLQLNEEYVINQSISKYGTDDPCIIYRTYITNNIHCKLDCYLRKCQDEDKNRMNISDLPNEFTESLCFDQTSYRLVIR